MRGEEHGDGGAEPAVVAGYGAGLVEEVVELEAILGQELLGVRLAVLDVDPDELDLVAELGVGLVEEGCLGAARETPRCPYVDDRRLVDAREVSSELDGVGLGQVGQGGPVSPGIGSARGQGQGEDDRRSETDQAAAFRAAARRSTRFRG